MRLLRAIAPPLLPLTRSPASLPIRLKPAAFFDSVGRLFGRRMAATSSVPVKLLHEAEGHDVTIELKSGELYRGRLLAAEETMNVQLSSVVHQARDGRVTRHVVIISVLPRGCRGRGLSQCTWFGLPWAHRTSV